MSPAKGEELTRTLIKQAIEQNWPLTIAVHYRLCYYLLGAAYRTGALDDYGDQLALTSDPMLHWLMRQYIEEQWNLTEHEWAAINPVLLDARKQAAYGDNRRE